MEKMETEMEVMKQTMINKLKGNTEKLRSSLIAQMEVNLQEMVEDFEKEITKLKTATDVYPGSENSPKSKSKGGREVKDKEFINRRSILTDLFEVNHIRTIYHVFIAILILLFLNTVIYDFVDTGKLNLDFDLIKYGFGDFHIVLAIWLGMKLSTCLILFTGFRFWACNRFGKSKAWDFAWLTAYIVYICAFFYYPAYKLLEHNLPPASSVVVLMEQIRLIMKLHGFVRSNIPIALKYKPHQGDEKQDNIPCPDFSKFLYFLFAPTLVYRDSYPRNKCIRWNYVMSNFGQVVGCLFYVYFVFVRFCVPVFHKFGREPFSAKNLVLSVFGCMMPGTIVLLCGFFAVLHSWLNAFAEMLTFADRMFYKDWWNSTTFANYYRTWNVVVHDWLYTYVYKDVYLLMPSNRLVPMLTVFTVSALVHEYIVTLTFRFFYPLLYAMFGGLGVYLVFLTDKREARSWNIFMWVSLFMGTGLLMSLYSM